MLVYFGSPFECYVWNNFFLRRPEVVLISFNLKNVKELVISYVFSADKWPID